MNVKIKNRMFTFMADVHENVPHEVWLWRRRN